MAIVLWLGGYKGIDILRSAGIIGEEKSMERDGQLSREKKSIDAFVVK